MAARLPVVISQAPQRDGSTVDFEEDLIARLMMAPGLDATLIGPVSSIRPDSTDHLCLQGFMGGYALVSWSPTEKLNALWAELELDGTIADMSVASPDFLPGPKKIFHFQITPSTSPDVLLDQMQKLLKSRNVQTVGIVMPGLQSSSGKAGSKTQPITPLKPNGSSVTPELSRTESSSTDSSTAGSAEKTSPELSKPPKRSAPVGSADAGSSAQRTEDEEWDDLDQLMNDFDALDL